MLGPTGHIDTFTRDNLPPEDQQPSFLLDQFQYPDYVNVGVELTDKMVEQGFGDKIALIGNGRQRSYQELATWTNKLANVLVDDLGVKPGNRILIRSANNPALVACWLAATKAGAVVVNTMPMLRAGELKKIIDKAQITHALCDTRLMDELIDCAKTSEHLKYVVGFDGTAHHDAELDRAALAKPDTFEAVKTGRDDVALLGFTSGTTGDPKATMHFHRDLLIIADGYAKEVLGVTSDDIFVGSPPLAFTFGLGGLAVFPLRYGATATLLETASPPNMINIIETYKATICFTSPTAYRAMMRAMDQGADLSSLRCAVSAGETLPAPVFDEWQQKTGKPMLDGIGSTEMLHIFISNRFESAQAGSTGYPVTGYEAKIVDHNMDEMPRGEPGHLAVRGPTGCRYLADKRQANYVKAGWNVTGDTFIQDEQGFFHFAARNDDMIVSSGYNIAGPEVETALLAHPYVVECAVVGAPDVDRGFIVQAHVVLEANVAADSTTIKTLQDYVKQSIAPYKYPRSIVFTDALPKTATGKIQRFKLRPQAAASTTDFVKTKTYFHLPAGVIYLDGNSLGPLPTSVKAHLDKVVEQEWGEQLIRGWNTAGWFEQPRRVGNRIAKLLGAADNTVVMGDTLSIKVYQALAAALALNPERKVVLSDSGNFPTDLYIAEGLLKSLGQGHVLKTPEPEAVEGLIDESVAVLMLTHVDYRTGRMHDMKRLTAKAHAQGIIVIWDLAHSAGAVPVDLTEAKADFAIGCTYKYLNGGPGSPAFIYVAPKHAEIALPALSGWMGHAAPFEFNLNYQPAEGIQRMRVGTPPVLALSALEAALDVWDEVTMPEVRGKSITLSELFIKLVEEKCPMLTLASPRNPEERGSQVSFRFEQAYAVMQALIAQGVIGDFRAPDSIRFGFTPLYIDETDVKQAVEVLAKVMHERLWDKPEYQQKAAVT
ncbi:kynureninase [uncultured Thiothrix sp.]|uniref:kynureninase n=1 Tax=uncultured Thiothrix sp. TaxID=223185 RepID=UPI00261D9767|nr:kynureninase [uncultured Thiothrix sp.]